MGAGEQLDAFIDECLLHHFGCGFGVVPENVRAALNQDNAGADAVEELGEFASDDTTSKDDHAWRNEIEI